METPKKRSIYPLYWKQCENKHSLSVRAWDGGVNARKDACTFFYLQSFRSLKRTEVVAGKTDAFKARTTSEGIEILSYHVIIGGIEFQSVNGLLLFQYSPLTRFINGTSDFQALNNSHPSLPFSAPPGAALWQPRSDFGHIAKSNKLPLTPLSSRSSSSKKRSSNSHPKEALSVSVRLRLTASLWIPDSQVKGLDLSTQRPVWQPGLTGGPTTCLSTSVTAPPCFHCFHASNAPSSMLPIFPAACFYFYFCLCLSARLLSLSCLPPFDKQTKTTRTPSFGSSLIFTCSILVWPGRLKFEPSSAIDVWSAYRPSASGESQVPMQLTNRPFGQSRPDRRNLRVLFIHSFCSRFQSRALDLGHDWSLTW